MPHFAAVALAVALLAMPLPAVAASLPAQPRPDPARVDRQLQQAWERLETVVEQYNDVREDLRATRARSAALATRIAPLRAAMDARQSRVGAIAAQAYRAAGVAEVSTLLAATSPRQFAHRLLIVHRLTTQQTRALSTLADARRGYESTRLGLAALAAEQRRHQLRLAEKRRHIVAEIERLERLRGGRPWRERNWPALNDGHVPPFEPGPAGRAVRFAYAQLGKPYRWGGAGPHGYDCSGLTSAAWRRAGVGLPHNSGRQWHAVKPISRAELRQGDLVFYYRDIHHVALYVGAGRVIHAPSHGERVRVEPMGYAPIYGYGRP